MILQISPVNTDQPRISSNQLGEFIFATVNRKREILKNQKFGSKFSAPYYAPALKGILRSFSDLSRK